MKFFQIDDTNGMLLNQLNKGNGTVLFYHPQCSHCVSMRPLWEQMKKKVQKKNCNIYEVNGEHMSSIHHPMKDAIQGFPSILNVNNGKLTEFEKERNTKNMTDFVLSNLQENNIRKKIANNKLKKKKVSFFINKNEDLMKKRLVAKRRNILNTLKLAKNRMNQKQKKIRMPRSTLKRPKLKVINRNSKKANGKKKGKSTSDKGTQKNKK